MLTNMTVGLVMMMKVRRERKGSNAAMLKAS